MKFKRLLGIISISTLLCATAIGCTNSKETETEATEKAGKETREDIIKMIKSYFDKAQWKFTQEYGEDDPACFISYFNGETEKDVTMIVRVYSNNTYSIIGCASKVVIPENHFSEGYKAVNEYNLHTPLVCCTLDPDGRIIFWLGRNTDGQAFSEEAFATDFSVILNEADEETSNIFKQAMNTTQE